MHAHRVVCKLHSQRPMEVRQEPVTQRNITSSEKRSEPVQDCYWSSIYLTNQ